MLESRLQECADCGHETVARYGEVIDGDWYCLVCSAPSRREVIR